MMINKIYFSTEELAEYLGVSKSTIIAYRTEGNGPKYLKIGRLVRYRISDVEDWIAEENNLSK